MYRVNDLSVGRSGLWLLDGVSCEFPVGKLCMVLGPNGAGKTTLLRCLDGGLKPSRGTVELDGRPLSQWTHQALATRRGVLPQHSNLDFPFTVWDVVLMGRSPHPTTDQENQAIVEQVLDYCDCLHLASRSFPTLSGGEQQRVHTARVLVQIWQSDNDLPRYLILDEPVSALDLSHQYALFHLLKGWIEKFPLGIICSLHNLNLAAQFADRCLLLDQGKLITSGTAQQVLTEPTLSRIFDLDMQVSPHPQNPNIPLIMPKLEA